MSEPGVIPAAAMPWVEAALTYSAEVAAAVLLVGDETRATEAYDAMVYEQNRFTSAHIAASSGAATELDYYREEADV